MKRRKFKMCIFAAALLLAGARSASAAPLFAGGSAADWHVAETTATRGSGYVFFAFTTGTLQVYPHAATAAQNSKPAPAMLVSGQTFGGFHLYGEYKFGPNLGKGRRNSGLIFGIHGQEKIWPASLQFQIKEGETGDLIYTRCRGTSLQGAQQRGYLPAAEHGVPVTTGTAQTVTRSPRLRATRELPGWNKFDLAVSGKTATLRVNGKLVNAATNIQQWSEQEHKWVGLQPGRIAFAAESSAVSFRNLGLEPLPRR